jgi:serine beta-lactamase-like protein LACTB
VSKNGQLIWSEGFGFADVESGAKCNGQSVMRIASISKPITAAIAAHQMEQGKLDLDKSIHVRKKH